MRPLGFEPRTCGLRVRCSAVELEARVLQRYSPVPEHDVGAVRRGLEGDRRGSNPRPPGPHPGALPAELRSPRRHQSGTDLRGPGHLTVPYAGGPAPVAQLDRAGGFYPSGCGFDSCRGASWFESGPSLPEESDSPDRWPRTRDGPPPRLRRAAVRVSGSESDASRRPRPPGAQPQRVGRPTVVNDGSVVGTWSAPKSGEVVTDTFDAFRPLPGRGSTELAKTLERSGLVP